ncbi:hypothetical protein [Vibrio nigripulchritudo]|uniref:hypothetical protein n=1 Tax=Vibrio nigripulchritudo TaxID=28173 RepID=UPI0003B1E454|nr:hypothetical protein [Vibrio nigripulchritudo]CCN72627.1 hypothetical protein VIBNISFn118_630017 [Vibrio nigripulchritudo SFn118]
MKIVREDALHIESEMFFFNGKIFNGSVLTMNNDLVVKRKLCVDGLITTEYTSPYIDLDKFELIVDSKSLDDEYEGPCVYQGSLFSGVAYRSYKGICESERVYKEGWLKTEINYRRDGTLESIDVGDDDISQMCSWFESGSVEEFVSFYRNNYRFWIKFAKENTITTLVIDGNYFSLIEKNKDSLELDMFSNLEELKNMNFSDYLFISGSGVNDEVFNILTYGNKLNNTTKLRISKSALSTDLIKILENYNNLEKIVIDGVDLI